MITIWRKDNGRRDLFFVNEVPSVRDLYTWLARNIAWTYSAGEIARQLRNGDRIARQELRAIAEREGYVFVEFGPTPGPDGEEGRESDD